MLHNQTRITIHVQPNAGRNEVVGYEGGVLRLKIAAPPVKCKANKELIEFLSDLLGVRKSSLAVEKGATGKNKVVSVIGLSQDEVSKRLAALSPKAPKNK